MNWFYRVCLISLALVLSACGGGGSGGCDAQLALGGAADCSSGTNTTQNNTNAINGYTAAASSGELIAVQLNTSASQIEYNLIDWPTVYARDAQTRIIPLSGAPTEDTYYAQSFSGKYAKNDAGLIFGMASESYSTSNAATQLPFLGILNLQTDPVKLQGIYNFLANQCSLSGTSIVCTPYYGTFRFNPLGTWDLCKNGDLYTSTCNSGSALSISGTSDTATNTGRITLRKNNQVIGNAMFTQYDQQKVLVIQFNDGVSTLNKSMLVGVPRLALDATKIKGKWYFTSQDYLGRWDTTLNTPVSGALAFTETIDPSSRNTPVSNTHLCMNKPWAGLIQTGTTTPCSIASPTQLGILDPSGVFVYADTSNGSTDFRVGLKK